MVGLGEQVRVGVEGNRRVRVSELAAGITHDGKRLSRHSLRHSYASLLIADSFDGVAEASPTSR
jgi:hypothetical protein